MDGDMHETRLTHDLKVFDSSMTLDDELGDQVEVGNIVAREIISVGTRACCARTHIPPRLNCSRYMSPRPSHGAMALSEGGC